MIMAHSPSAPHATSVRRVRRLALFVLLACICAALLWTGRVAMASDEPAEVIEGDAPLAPAVAEPHGAVEGASVGETPVETGTVDPLPDDAPADIEVDSPVEATPAAVEEQAAPAEEAAAPPAPAAEDEEEEEEEDVAPDAATTIQHDEDVMETFDARAEYNDEVAAEQAAAAATAAEVVAPPTPIDEDASPDLDSLNDEELKTILSDKKKGQVNFKHYKSREELIAAIRVELKKEAARRAFREEVAAAARWYAEQQEERKYQAANARRLKASRIKHGIEVPAALQRHGEEGEPVHELRVVYNEANGYGARFAAMQQDLEESEVKLPNLSAFRLVGEPYQMSTERIMIGKGLQVCFFGTLAAAVVPDMVPFLPEAVRNVMRTRRGLVLSTAFLFNVLSSSALQNGAFEVYLDNELIYSTMQMGGRLPTSEMVSTMVLERTLLKDYTAAMAAKAAKK